MNNVTPLNEIYDEIEGKDLFIEANLAPSYHIFNKTLSRTPAFLELLRALNSPEVRGRILARVKNLAESEIDDRFENPWDVALSAYVTALARKNLFHSTIAMGSARKARNTWWLAHALRAIPTVGAVFSIDPRESGSVTEAESFLDALRTSSPSIILEPYVLGDLTVRTLHDPYMYEYEPGSASAGAS